MAPQKLLDRLKNMQSASNTLVLTMSATSYSIGEYIDFLSGEEDFTEAKKYCDKVVECLKASSAAMIAYCDAVNALNALSKEDTLYE